MSLDPSDRYFSTHDTPIVDDFEDFIGRLDRHVDDSRGEWDVVSLFDAFEIWLTNDNGFWYCPTYESFLEAVPQLIEWWMEQDPSPDERVWRGRETPLFDGAYGHNNYDRVRHPMLTRRHYEAIREQRRTREHWYLRDRLDALVEHLGVPIERNRAHSE